MGNRAVNITVHGEVEAGSGSSNGGDRMTEKGKLPEGSALAES